SHSGPNSLHFASPDSSKPTVQLPYEILALIFQFLPASDLFSVVAVNRLWRQIAFLETKQVDLSECFPMDCLGLENEVYSDFDFVYNLFSMFPLISSLVIKDRYMRDRDMRVVTAGILAGKMAFTEARGPAIGSDAYRDAQNAIALKRQQKIMLDECLKKSETGSSTEERSNTASAKPNIKVMRGTIREELREFSRSVGTYVLIPQTRNTLRKKILERLELNLEHREIQDYCWMLENNIDPSVCHISSSTSIIAAAAVSSNKKDNYPLVPLAHYRFHDCCFANDWGAAMDVNKLPMIGLAAAFSQGLVVDLEGSYGAPSQSIKTMLGFCFGAHCVLSLDLNFRHTHMELEHVVELLSENPILYKVDIVDSPAFHDLIRLPALGGLGSLWEKMQESCLNLDEAGLDESLRRAKIVLLDLERAVQLEEAAMKDDLSKKERKVESTIVGTEDLMSTSPPVFNTQPYRALNDPSKPIESLSQQLTYINGASQSSRIRTAKILLKGVVSHGIAGLINTRDRNTGQSFLHSLAWRRSYYSLTAIPTDSLPTPPSQQGSEMNTSPFFSTSLPSSSTLPSSGASSFPTSHSLPTSGNQVAGSPANTIVEPESESQASTSSGLSSLISISTLPAALSSALSFRRLSLPATLWIPKDSEDIGVGGGSLPTPDLEDDEVYNPLLDDSTDFITNTEAEPIEAATVDMTTTTESQGLPVIVVPDSTTKKANATVIIPEQHPVAIALRLAKMLLEMEANPNVYNKDGRSAVLCASFMGFQPMETLLIERGGYSKELVRIRETM
ncbi:hypothetical protein BGZ46_008385, partial [Entomortierella lignicola]